MARPSTATPDLHIAATHDQVAGQTPGPWSQKIALSLDGGGVRGYWSLLVLQHLMRVIQDFEIAEDGTTRSSFHPCEKPMDVSHLNNLDILTGPFLPCHYFDYIGGTSTGALIAILLSAFRMTVEDCLDEYEKMAGAIFKNPRMFHKMNTLTGWNKYSTKALEKAIQEVIERRAQLRVGDDREALFQTEIDTCRGVVLATRLSVVDKRFMFRSYTPYDDWRREKGRKNVNLFLRNPNEGMRISVLKVALAGTAAPFYFGHYQTVLSTPQAQAAVRPPTRNRSNISRTGTSWTRRQNDIPEGKSLYKFEDAGFGSANNPCWELYREIQHHHGQNTPVLVSIGTARPKEEFVGESAAALIRRGLHQLGNPEEVHEKLEQDMYNGQYSYYRLNDEDGIKIEMDEWKPKKVGSETIARMRTQFHQWLQKDGVEDKFRECAEHLVRLRRVRMTTPRWERFALGQYFVCQVRNCPKDRDNQWLDRADFENHLTREHRVEDYGGSLDGVLETCRRIWRYRPRGASS